MTDQLHFHNKTENEPIYRSTIAAGEDEIKFRLLIKLGQLVLLDWEGHPRNRRSIALADLKELVEAESVIEKATGLRVHIIQVVD